MKKLKLFNGSGIATLIASIALAFSFVGANTYCCFIYHQPEKPDLKKLRKF